MLAFSEPIWLMAAAAVGLAGVGALWRSRRRGTAVSSLKLWREVGVSGGEVRRRRVDPLWVLVWVAGVLAAGALGGPKWIGGGRARVDVEWAVRSVGESAEAWVRVPGGEEGWRLWVNGVEGPAGGALREGVAVPVAGGGGRVKLELRGPGGVVAGAEFVRPAGAGREFGLTEVTDAGAAAEGGRIDAALERAFLVQPGVREGDPSVRPRVMLVNSRQVGEEELAGAALVVAEPETALPGVKVGSRVEAGLGGWRPEVEAGGGGGIGWPGFVKLEGVRVQAVREAELSGEWRVLARVEGRPWVAVRQVRWKDGGRGVWVWLGSRPLEETNWPREAGFVVFFGEMAREALGGAGGVVVWEQARGAAELPVRAVGLAVWVGVAGMGLLVVAVVWFVGRGG